MADKAPYRYNLRVTGITRDEVRDGVTYLVVPVVMLKEGVLRCSNCHPGGELISAEEIRASVPAWDNRPVTLRHPTEPWMPSNARRLEVGRLFGTIWDGKLKAEMWIDVQAIRRTMEGREAESRFRKGEVVEVSTGYFTDHVSRPGSFEGTKFALRQTGIIPDHLAILTDEVGACSVEGGCGAPRFNSNEGDPVDESSKLLKGLKKLLGILGDEEDEDTEGDGDAGDGDADGSKAGSENAGGDAAPPAAGDDGDSGGDTPPQGGGMDEKERKELVARLLASGKVQTFDEEGLLKMSDEQLNSLAELAGCGCRQNAGDDGDAGDGGGEGNAAGDGDGDGAEGGDDRVTLSREDAEFVTGLRQLSGGTVEGLQGLIEAGKAEAERRESARTELIERLNKDERVAMPERVLKELSLEALEGLDRTLDPSSYLGAHGPRIENEADDDIPAPPAIITAPLEKEG